MNVVALPSRLLPLALATPLALSLLGPVSGASSDDVIPFADLAQELLERNGYTNPDASTFDVEELLDKAFVHVRLGLFEAYALRPAAEQKSRAADFQKVLLALLDAQEKWLDWLAPGGVDQAQARKDLETLRRWARSVRGGNIQTAAKAGASDLLVGLAAKDTVLEAARRFATYMGTGAALGLEREEVREPLILAPTRRDFIQLLAFAGWVRPENQGIFWQPAVADWTSFYFDEYKVVALELSAPGRAKDDWEKGVGFDTDIANGMEQQVAQHAANSLLDNYFGARIPPALAGGLAVNLVIDVYGQCDTRVDGDLRERRTDAREMFVPGGLSEGGVLAKNSADSRWRVDQGAERFVEVLKVAQKKGASKADRREGKLKHFELHNDDGNARMVVSGPFLGSAAAPGPAPPEAFQGDHLEFLRSYRTAFVHWLRSESEKKKAAEERFARFLADLAKAPSADELERVFSEVYEGAPLSTTELGADDLEGRFLRWLEKQ